MYNCNSIDNTAFFFIILIFINNISGIIIILLNFMVKLMFKLLVLRFLLLYIRNKKYLLYFALLCYVVFFYYYLVCGCFITILYASPSVEDIPYYENFTTRKLHQFRNSIDIAVSLMYRRGIRINATYNQNSCSFSFSDIFSLENRAFDGRSSVSDTDVLHSYLYTIGRERGMAISSDSTALYVINNNLYISPILSELFPNFATRFTV